MGDFLEEQRRRINIMIMMEREDEHTENEADNDLGGSKTSEDDMRVEVGREESVVGIVEEMAEQILDDEAIMMDVGRLKCMDDLLSGQFMCGIECTRIPELEERNKENIPFAVDRGVNRILEAMVEEGRGTATRIVGKMDKELSKLGENEEIVKVWQDGGLMETDRGSRSGASVEAMERFERYWGHLETNEIFERLGQFEVTERDGRGALPESPERRARRGGMARKRRRVVQQQLHEVMGRVGSRIATRRDQDVVIDLTIDD
ncbi:hypothetical protein L210DRAFT_3650027 [Boletus edulis BED1]|uniref:Uncharacterized protein n=1 Tax=Boletus edulis BED1 TaxID=1328754 RepID=A0AAD4BJM2_BOLED|nr:hypothetical protein L210DRAFT_3650027 [Boletus edulis BED1]